MQLMYLVSNAQVKVLGTINTNGTSDDYPTHIDSLGKGGYVTVATISDRNAITNKRRKHGMLVFVQSEGVIYKLNAFNPASPTITNSDWVIFSSGATTGVDAGTLTGTTLASTITGSSLTSVGTITSGVWSGTAVSVAKGGTGLTAVGTAGQVLSSTGSGTLTWTNVTATNVNAGNLTGTTLASNVTGSSLTSVGRLTNLAVTNAISGNITGTAALATKLATARNINGVAFDGSQNITITASADAATLSGTTLNSTITGSSLTSVGTLTSATVNGKVIVGASSAASASAVLEASSTTQGFLPPRMSGAQRDAISSKVAGLVVWCSNCGSNGELQVYNGTTWTNMIGGDASLALVVGMEYQGGKIAYILQSGEPGYDPKIPHGIIAATSDQGRVKWNNNDFNSFTAVGATGTALGTGLTNTNTIIENQGPSSSHAAGLARAYNGGEYTDWYLPSKDELAKLYLNRVAIGGFSGSGGYWSSTEQPSLYAYLQFFYNGDNPYTGKDQSNRVRAIRAF
jgi:hypothetical protein